MPMSLSKVGAFIRESLQLVRQAFLKPYGLKKELGQISPHLASGVPVRRARKDLKADERRVILQSVAAVASGAMAWPILGGLGALWLGHPFPWDRVALVGATSLLFGVGGVLGVNVLFGINMGWAVSLAGALIVAGGSGVPAALNQADQASATVLLGLGIGLGLGLILGLAVVATFLSKPAPGWFLSVSTAGGGLALGVLFARTGGWDADAIISAAILAVFYALGFLTGYGLGYCRLPVFLVELAWQVGLTGLSGLLIRTKVKGAGQWACRFYRLSPIHQDELIWFRLRTLDRQLVGLAAAGERQLALEAINTIGRIEHQCWAAEAALVALLTRDLRGCARIPEIAGVAERLSWYTAIDLPSPALWHAVRLFNEASRNIEAATHTLDEPGWQINLRSARDNLETLQETLDQMDRRLAGALRPIVQGWRDNVEQALEAVFQNAGPVLIENIYIAGNPIQPEQAQVFVGRQDLFVQIQADLDARQKPTLFLYGQRRAGKTSLLLQLVNQLSPDYIPVYVDLKMTAAVDGMNRFLYTLAREAVRQADEKRGMTLPAVDVERFDRQGQHAFFEWLDLTHRKLGNRLLLLSLDEFEKIEEAIGKGKLEEGVLDILQNLIQIHSPWLVLLFSGVRTPDQMSRAWQACLKSVRLLPISYLDRQAAGDLVLLPSHKYPIRYAEEAVEAILDATHAQPFLMQAACFELVQYLNSKGRRMGGPFSQVTLPDAQEAVRRTAYSARPFFYDLWGSSGEAERYVLAEMAHQHKEWAQIDRLAKQKRWSFAEVQQAIEQLTRRELIETREQECRLCMPAMRQWMLNEISPGSIALAHPASAPALQAEDER